MAGLFFYKNNLLNRGMKGKLGKDLIRINADRRQAILKIFACQFGRHRFREIESLSRVAAELYQLFALQRRLNAFCDHS